MNPLWDRSRVQPEVRNHTYTEPAVKGDTSSGAMKNATVETGAEIKVPLFINIGDKVKVDTATGSYVERVKELVAVFSSSSSVDAERFDNF